MPSTEWSAKRKRQYQHIEDSVLARGQSEPLAEEIAARTFAPLRIMPNCARSPN